MPALFKQLRNKPALIGIVAIILFIIYLNFNSLIFDLIFKVIFNYTLSPSVLFIISCITMWMFFGGLYLYTIKIENRQFLIWKEINYTFDFYIIWIVVIFVATYVSDGLINLPFKYPDWYSSRGSRGFLHLNLPLRFWGVLTAAVFEELIFRGYLISRLQLYFKNIHGPVLISAAVFAMGHIGYGIVAYTLDILVSGLILGYHYQKYHNIKVLIILHFLLDYYVLIMVYK